MIEAISLQNYRAFKDATVRLSPLTLVVGPNASGKTSILRALRRFCEWFRTPQFALDDSDRANGCHSTPPADRLVKTRLDLGGSRTTGFLGLQYRTDRALGTSPPVVTGGWDGVEFEFLASFRGVRIEERRSIEEWASAPGDSVGVFNAARSAIPSASLISLEPSKLASPSSSDELGSGGFENGSGLPALLVDLSSSYGDAYRELKESMRIVVPGFRNFRLERVPLSAGPGRAIVFDFENAKGLNASEVSEGTLLTLGILAFGYAGNQPGLLLIDELERGLHPRALSHLVRILRQVIDRVPGRQIVATTHSPYLVDQFTVDEVRVTSLLSDGSAAIASLADCPDIGKWRDSMGAGEMWSAVGEKWVAEAARAKAADGQ